VDQYFLLSFFRAASLGHANWRRRNWQDHRSRLLGYASPICCIILTLQIPVIGYVAVTTVTAFLVQGLQVLLGTSKRSIVERAEELGAGEEEIPLAQTNHRSDPPSESPTAAASREPSIASESLPAPTQELQAPLRAQDPSRITGTGGPPERMPLSAPGVSRILRHDPVPLSRAERWAAFANNYLDFLTYGSLFVLVGIPVYFTTGYAMPAQLPLNVLAYHVAVALPVKWKRFLHPVMVSSLITVMGIWILAICRGESLDQGLHAYQTKTRYIQLLQGKQNLPYPGTGDMFSTVLDAAIVALALPMFQYRHELRRQVRQI
jgi:hypothetical protein